MWFSTLVTLILNTEIYNSSVEVLTKNDQLKSKFFPIFRLSAIGNILTQKTCLN